jgi:hypothetical protein
MTRHAIAACCCLVLALHALGPALPIDQEPEYAIAGSFAAIAGLFGLAALRQAIQRNIADEHG